MTKPWRAIAVAFAIASCGGAVATTTGDAGPGDAAIDHAPASDAGDAADAAEASPPRTGQYCQQSGGQCNGAGGACPSGAIPSPPQDQDCPGTDTICCKH